MADIRIIDIDGERWNLKDQESRNIIAVLKQKNEENANIIERLNKNVQEGFFARRRVKKISVQYYEPCFISGYVNGVGAYMAVLASLDPDEVEIKDLYGSVSNHIGVKALGEWKFELSLDGPINVFGFAREVS